MFNTFRTTFAAAGAALLFSCTASAQAQSYAPDFPDVKATPLSPAEMDATRGQGVPKKVKEAAVKAIGKALGKKVGAQLEALIDEVGTPSFSEYRKAFGTKTAIVLSLLPPLLKPKIAY